MGKGAGAMTGGKRPEEIEAEIARTRSDLTETLEALEDQLAPRQLLEKGLGMVRHSMNGDSVGRIGEVIKSNPIPLALIGIGLGWMMLANTGAGRSAGRYTQRLGSRVGDAVGDAASAMGDRVRGMIGRGEDDYAHAWTKNEEAARRTAADMPGSAEYGDTIREESGRRRAFVHAREAAGRAYGAVSGRVGDSAGRVGEYGRHAWDTAGDYADSAGRRIGHARDRFGDLMEEYPLAVGAIGFIIGAAAAAALPSTRFENEYFGETRDDFLREAEETGRDMVNRAREVASTAASAATDAARDAVKETAEAVKEEAERQGLAGSEMSQGKSDKV
jgi:hypothetical protein